MSPSLQAILPSTAAILILAHTALALFFRLHTPAQWVAFAERSPRVARFIRPGSGVEHVVLDVLTAMAAQEADAADKLVKAYAGADSPPAREVLIADALRILAGGPPPLPAARPRVAFRPLSNPGEPDAVEAAADGDHPDVASLELAAADALPALGVLEGAAARGGAVAK